MADTTVIIAVSSIGAFLVLFAIAAIVCLVIIYYIIARRRKRRQGQYQPLHQPGRVVTSSGELRYQQQRVVEVGLFEAMQRQRQEQESNRRETGLLNCQYYLRSGVNQKYRLESHLPDIGSRLSKNWFMVYYSSAGNYISSPFLLIMLPISQQCRINLQSSDRHVIRKLFKAIEHPYIHRIADVDYIPDRKLVVIIEPFVSRGSLKDLIYQTTPSLSWATKYSVRRNGLNLNQIKNYGRQILEAVSYLLFVGFNPFGQIQSGNIYVEGSRCRLSGCDNSLLGYKPRIFRTLKHYKDSIDSAMFGHLLYELSSGRELTSPAPNEEDYDSIRLPQVVQVIKFIFQNESGRIPSIADILELPFFKNVKTPELDHWNSSEHVVIEQDVTDIIAKSKKGRTRHSTKKSRTSRGGASEAAAYPTFQAKGTTGAAPSNTSSTVSNKASSRTTKPSAPPSTSTAATDRTSLLSDIRSGTPLRHTETNDRSAPIIS